MDNYDAIIIGSGIGGLTCGCLLAKHGLKTLILEQHTKPGGYVTSYKRQGFTFDTLHTIGGLRKGASIHRILEYLGITKKIEFLELDKVLRFIYPDCTVNCYSDSDKYEEELITHFPKEKDNIHQFFSLLNIIYDELLASSYRPNLLQYLSYPFRFPSLVKYKNKTFGNLLNEFQFSLKLREIISSTWGYIGLEPDRMAAIIGTLVYMSYLREGAFVPNGGFQKLANAFAQCFSEYGGEVRFKSRVEKIITQNSSAIGVRLKNREELYARHIISNADTKQTFLKLLDNQVFWKKLSKKVEAMEQSISGFSVHLGVKMTIPQEFSCGTNIYVPYYGATKRIFGLHEMNEMEQDPVKLLFGVSIPTLANQELAPPGCHCLDLLYVPAPYGYRDNWKRNDRAAYDQLKEECSEKIIQAAEVLFPNLSKHIMVKDISTPLTYERYTSATAGAWYDVALTPQQTGLARMSQKTSIKGLFMTGTKAFPGHGFYSAVISGSFTADEILARSLTGGKYLFPNN